VNARGFSLVELMVAMAIFLIICAAMFELLQAFAAEVCE